LSGLSRAKIFASRRVVHQVVSIMQRILISACLLLSAACTYAGNGQGVLLPVGTTPAQLREQHGTTTFHWTTRGTAMTGQIAAELPGGRKFQGSFAQTTAPVTTRSSFDSPYRSWGVSPTTGSFAPNTTAPQAASVHYGSVLMAELSSRDGSSMHCQFVLQDPVRGIPRGARGECQLSTGEHVAEARLERSL
jgi:hypothetical protein